MSSLKDKLDELLKTSIPNNGVPGAVFLALRRDGTAIYASAIGSRALGDEHKMTEDTVFWLASATKVLTAMCAIRCVDQGLIGLDENVLPHLPDLEKQQVYDFGTSGFKFVPREGNISLRQLLSMTAGVSYPILESLFASRESIPTGTTPCLPADTSVYVGPLECQPGTKWSYSGAIDWVGALVEKLSGTSLGDYLKQNILEPCGVTDISFVLSRESREKLARAHFRWPDARITSRGDLYSDDVRAHLGGCGAYGTAEALAEVLLVLINEGKHPKTGKLVLSSKLVAEMFRGQLNDQQRDWLDLPTPSNKNMLPLFPGIFKQWGLGFLLMPQGSPWGRGAPTGTWAGMANTHWMVDLEKGVVMTVFSQIIPQEDEALLETKQQFETIIYESL